MNLILYEKERDTQEENYYTHPRESQISKSSQKSNCISRENAKNKPYTIEITSLKMTLNGIDKSYRSKDGEAMRQNNSKQK